MFSSRNSLRYEFLYGTMRLSIKKKNVSFDDKKIIIIEYINLMLLFYNYT